MTILDYWNNEKRVVAVIDGLRETETQLLHHVMHEFGYSACRRVSFDGGDRLSELAVANELTPMPHAVLAFGRNAHNAVWPVMKDDTRAYYLTHPYKIRDKRFKGVCPPPTMQYEKWRQSIGRAVK